MSEDFPIICLECGERRHRCGKGYEGTEWTCGCEGAFVTDKGLESRAPWPWVYDRRDGWGPFDFEQVVDEVPARMLVEQYGEP